MQQKPSSETANGGPGGHFALGIKAPRRPFCPLSAGGKWTPFSAPAGAEPFPAAQAQSGMPRADGLRILSLSRLRRQLPPDRGRFCGNAGRHRTPQKRRFCGDPENSIDFRQMNCRKSDAGTRRRGPRAICPAPRERRNAAGSRFVRRPRRFDQTGPPAQTAPGKGTMFLP